MGEDILAGSRAHLLPRWAMEETSRFHRLMFGFVLSRNMRRTLRKRARELTVPRFEIKDMPRDGGGYETTLLFSHGENDADFAPFIRLLKRLDMYVHILYRDAAAKSSPKQAIIPCPANDNELVLSRPQAA